MATKKPTRPKDYINRILGHVPSTHRKGGLGPSDLDKEFFRGRLIECSITGYPFVYENSFGTHHNPLCPSPDQIIPSAGYFKDNVQMVLACVNKMRGNLPLSDFIPLFIDISICFLQKHGYTISLNGQEVEEKL